MIWKELLAFCFDLGFESNLFHAAGVKESNVARRKQEWPRDTIEEIDWWDKEIDGIMFRFVIKRITKEDPLRWQRKVYYPVTVRRADGKYSNWGNAFDEQPTRDQVEGRFPKEELKKKFGRQH